MDFIKTIEKVAETKFILYLLGNTLGFGVYFLGIMETGEGWKQNILFAMGAIFLTIKIGVGILDLVKKKYSLMKTLSIRKTE